MAAHPDAGHFARLERLYLAAPTNAYYRPEIRIGPGSAEIRLAIRPDFHHAMQAAHGSVYFKLLDDAGYFAVNSLVTDTFVLTTSFTIYFLRPVAEGIVTARGRVLHPGRRTFLAEARLEGPEGHLLGHGTGEYTRGRTPIPGAPGALAAPGE
jgi:uncharacterized protein (TIGR00369 family)